MTRPSDDALWRSVEHTVRDVLLPAIADEWARLAAIQLVGLATYARGRGPDPTSARAAALAAVLDELARGGNEIVLAHWPGETAPQASASALSDALLRDDIHADGVRAALRPLLVANLDADLAESAVLGPPFRGRLPDA